MAVPHAAKEFSVVDRKGPEALVNLDLSNLVNRKPLNWWTAMNSLYRGDQAGKELVDALGPTVIR
jgi:hypothetical protein